MRSGRWLVAVVSAAAVAVAAALVVSGCGEAAGVGDRALVEAAAPQPRPVARIGPRRSTGWAAQVRGARVTHLGQGARRVVRFRQTSRRAGQALLATRVAAARSVRVTAVVRVPRIDLRPGERRALVAVGTGRSGVRLGVARTTRGAKRWAVWRIDGRRADRVPTLLPGTLHRGWTRVELRTAWDTPRGAAAVRVGRRRAALPHADLDGAAARVVTIGLGQAPPSRGLATVLLRTATVATVPVATPEAAPDPPPPAAPAPAPAPAPPPPAPPPLLLDRFDGDALNAGRWSTCHWWGPDGCTVTGSGEVQWYLPGQVSVGGGTLRLTAERRDVTGDDGRRFTHASGMISSGPPRHEASPKFAFLYGRAELRARVPAGAGTWSAFWMLPADEESRPEIDVMEILGRTPGILRMHVHFRAPDGSLDDRGHDWVGEDLSRGWHRYAIDWRPGVLVWSLDGVERWRIEGPEVPSEPMYLVTNLAVGGVWAGEPDAAAFPAALVVDEIRVTQP